MWQHLDVFRSEVGEAFKKSLYLLSKARSRWVFAVLQTGEGGVKPRNCRLHQAERASAVRL